tara:strand:+ start:872 stop:1336 length:465 start_codon:yes stop_codon:yes gene_type:complete
MILEVAEGLNEIDTSEEKSMTRSMGRRELRQLIEAQVEALPQMLPDEGAPDDMPKGVITKVQGAEPDHDGDGMGPDDDGRKLGHGGKSRMTRQHLYKIAEYGVELWNMLDDEDEIPEWCQSKIAVMADSISKVKHHLEYKIVKPEDGELELDDD